MASTILGKFQNIRSQSKGKPSAAPVEELASLPLETLTPKAPAADVSADRQRELFDATLQNLKACLMQAKRGAVLARSQSTEIAKRKALCQDALNQYQKALESRNCLRSLTARMDLEDRRRVRAIEGAPEWRTIRHAIQKSAEFNHLALSFAA